MSKSTKEILLEAYRRGRAWDPSHPNLLNLDEAAVKKMDGSEQDAKELIASLQMSDLNMESLVAAFHKRNFVADGDIGPATQELVELKRCPIPDFPPPPNASFHYDDPGLQKAVETMQENAMGSGSWPSCDPEREGVNSFRVRIDPAKMPSAIKSYSQKALDAVVAAYAEMGCAVRYILAASGDCEIAKRFENLAGSVIGWNEFPQPNTCRQTINGRLDTGYIPNDYRYWANLECHETGHGVGLQHTRGSIMNPSILLVWPLTWKGSPSEASMRRYFGGEPLNPPTPPVGEVPQFLGRLRGEQGPHGIAIRGVIDVVIKPTTKPGTYRQICVPAGVANEFQFEPKTEF